MTQKNLFTLLLFSLLFLASSCFPDNSAVYDGPLQVEFSPTSYTMNLPNETNYEANVQLIGEHQNSAITVRFEIDQDATTATRGVHFDIDGDSAQIPANNSFASIDVQAYPDAFEGQSLQVVINLLGDESGEVIPAHRYKSLTLTINP